MAGVTSNPTGHLILSPTVPDAGERARDHASRQGRSGPDRYREDLRYLGRRRMAAVPATTAESRRATAARARMPRRMRWPWSPRRKDDDTGPSEIGPNETGPKSTGLNGAGPGRRNASGAPWGRRRGAAAPAGVKPAPRPLIAGPASRRRPPVDGFALCGPAAPKARTSSSGPRSCRHTTARQATRVMRLCYWHRGAVCHRWVLRLAF